MSGWEGKETEYEKVIHNRGITVLEHETKMANLNRIAREGLRVMKAVRHDKYQVKGRSQYYNPYNNTWYGNSDTQ